MHDGASRRLFAIINQEIHVTELGDRRGHLQWFVEVGWLRDFDDPLFEQIVRGHYVPAAKRLVGYIGQDMRGGHEVNYALTRRLPELIDKLNVGQATVVYSGGPTKEQIVGGVADVLQRIKAIPSPSAPVIISRS